MVFNATFNNISGIMWQSVLLVEETGVPAENQRPESFMNRTLNKVLILEFVVDLTVSSS
jgi:hypothetical protein